MSLLGLRTHVLTCKLCRVRARAHTRARHLRKGKFHQEERKQKRDFAGLVSKMFTPRQIILNVVCVHPGEVTKYSDLSARLWDYESWIYAFRLYASFVSLDITFFLCQMQIIVD